MALTSQQLKGQKKLHFSVYKTALVMVFLASFEVQGIDRAPKESEEALKSSFLRSKRTLHEHEHEEEHKLKEEHEHLLKKLEKATEYRERLKVVEHAHNHFHQVVQEESAKIIKIEKLLTETKETLKEAKTTAEFWRKKLNGYEVKAEQQKTYEEYLKKKPQTTKYYTAVVEAAEKERKEAEKSLLSFKEYLGEPEDDRDKELLLRKKNNLLEKENNLKEAQQQLELWELESKLLPLPRKEKHEKHVVEKHILQQEKYLLKLKEHDRFYKGGNLWLNNQLKKVNDDLAAARGLLLQYGEEKEEDVVIDVNMEGGQQIDTTTLEKEVVEKFTADAEAAKIEAAKNYANYDGGDKDKKMRLYLELGCKQKVLDDWNNKLDELNKKEDENKKKGPNVDGGNVDGGDEMVGPATSTVGDAGDHHRWSGDHRNLMKI